MSTTTDGGFSPTEQNSDSPGPAANAPTTSAPDAALPEAFADGDQSAELHAAAAENGSTTDSGPPKADPSDSYGRFKELVLSCTAPVIISRKWAFLPQPKLRIDMSPSDFAGALEEVADVEAMIALRFYERTDDGHRLATWLDGDGSLYVEFDDERRETRFSRGGEFLFPMERTALDFALARKTGDSPEAPETLYVVASTDDAEILQGLVLPAVSSEGLDQIAHDHVARIFDGNTDVSWRHFLLLLDFDIANLKSGPMPAIAAVIQRLADVQAVYQVDLGRRFGICRPTPKELRTLERAVSFHDPKPILETLEVWSAAARNVKVTDWESQIATERPSLSAATMALTRALEQPDGLLREFAVKAALPAYLSTRRKVLKSFYEKIDGACDPIDQILWAAAAGHAEQFLKADPRLCAAQQMLAGRATPSIDELELELLERQQHQVSEIRRIRNDLKSKR